MTTQQALIEQWRKKARLIRERLPGGEDPFGYEQADTLEDCANDLEALLSPVSGEEEGRKAQEQKPLSRGEPSLPGTAGSSRSPLQADSHAVQAENRCIYVAPPTERS